MSTIFDIRYLQLSLGSIKDERLPASFKSGYGFQAARTLSVARVYFFESTSGFKQLAKIPGVIDAYLEYKGIGLNSARIATLFDACGAVKGLITITEPIVNTKGVVNPAHHYSVWSGKPISLYEWALAKGADVADWTMAVCDTHKWIAKIGFVTARAWTELVFNFASLVFIAYNVRTESAKWWTGKVIDPITGKRTDFNNVDKIKSLFTLAIMASYLGLTVISFVEMAKYRVAHVAFLNFALLTAEVGSTIGSHFCEKLL